MHYRRQHFCAEGRWQCAEKERPPNRSSEVILYRGEPLARYEFAIENITRDGDGARNRVTVTSHEFVATKRRSSQGGVLV